jgi:hopanoid biosynthesis associated protein HpnK
MTHKPGKRSNTAGLDDPAVIFTADDFGHSHAINTAVIQAHREGVLTGASLMVTGEAAEEAIALARENPTLAVGLHVVLVAGRAMLSPEEIPHLVDRNGRFSDDPLRAGLRYAFNRAGRTELRRELTAQFERFAATGLPLAHVDSHLLMHMHPVVFDLLLPLAEGYGASGLRLPRDDLWLALTYDRRDATTKMIWAVAFGLLDRRALARLHGRRLVITDQVYGLMQSGRMAEGYVVGLLRRLEVPTAELYFHPSAASGSEALGPQPGDLATLLSPAICRVIRERGLRLATYPALRSSLKDLRNHSGSAVF